MRGPRGSRAIPIAVAAAQSRPTPLFPLGPCVILFHVWALGGSCVFLVRASTSLVRASTCHSGVSGSEVWEKGKEKGSFPIASDGGFVFLMIRLVKMGNTTSLRTTEGPEVMEGLFFDDLSYANRQHYKALGDRGP